MTDEDTTGIAPGLDIEMMIVEVVLGPGIVPVLGIVLGLDLGVVTRIEIAVVGEDVPIPWTGISVIAKLDTVIDVAAPVQRTAFAPQTGGDQGGKAGATERGAITTARLQAAMIVAGIVDRSEAGTMTTAGDPADVALNMGVPQFDILPETIAQGLLDVPTNRRERTQRGRRSWSPSLHATPSGCLLPC
eukprot:gnl/TRDRNA2_/TRDRNA2_172572_c2_seq1.p2 gnl/TRDRNA2_/TRDRNA2_172572_c2~~gnl/TRDRNA2_/TRDRNA2_172572_c2_seq1.p2  ORF type:complete len:189 (+),score=15.13 gnl/TRDRNA2_/TRDRNA2_172572_c2_seq1:459-1025(+)